MHLDEHKPLPPGTALGFPEDAVQCAGSTAESSSLRGDAVFIYRFPSVFLQCLPFPLCKSLDHMMEAAEKLLFLIH